MRVSRRFEYILVVLIVVTAAFYARYEYIPTFADRHVEVAAQKYDLDISEPGEWFSAWSLGDGQAFAVIAADPTGDKLSVEIKEPAYRFSRAGYGWASAVGSLGREPWIPYGMALVGALAVAGTTLLALRLRQRIGPRIWLILVNPAIYIGFAGDTAEPLAVLLLVWAVSSTSVVGAVLLGVTRPSYLVALFGRWRQIGFGVLATAGILLYAAVRFGIEDFVPDGGRIDLPLRAYFENPSSLNWLLAGAALATFVVGLRRRDWSWVASGLLVLSIGTDVTADPVNAWRAAGMLPVLWAFGTSYGTGAAVSDERLGSRIGGTGR